MEYLNEIDKLLKGDIFFVEIGAMDGKRHDSMYKYIQKYNWKGILIEPLPDMFEKSKKNYSNKDNLLFENSAISSYKGTHNIYRILDDVIKENKLENWADGISSFYKTKHINEFDKYITNQIITCITFQNLVDKYNIKKIDVLQIDTEGHDLIILQLILPLFQPLFIKVEYKHLKREDRKTMRNLLIKYGYKISTASGDYICTFKSV